MSRIFTCAVVQGNLRHGTSEVLACLTSHFDRVILSTWDDELQEKIPKGDFDVVLSKKPVIPGYTHRNFQRLGMAAGIRRAEELGATHVLKWRTDMLPTRLDVQKLIEWSSTNIPSGLKSRLVTCAFRNLSVKQDWFSTIPDLFAFADIELMKMLWDDASFDYSGKLNIPEAMLKECGSEWCEEPEASGTYCAEAELYANFKARLQQSTGKTLTHPEIAKQYMTLINHRRLGICWFGERGQFRSILQALQHPWWTEWTWKHGSPRIVEAGYHETSLWQKLRRKHLTPNVIKCELFLQKRWYRQFLR